jgi:N-acetylneuraminic acid mutarotase
MIAYCDLINPDSKIPTGRYYSSSCIYEDRLFIIGGMSNDNQNDVWEYDMEFNTWSNWGLKNTTLNRFGLTICADRSHIYAFGGTLNASNLTNSLNQSDLLKFDP